MSALAGSPSSNTQRSFESISSDLAAFFHWREGGGEGEGGGRGGGERRGGRGGRERRGGEEGGRGGRERRGGERGEVQKDTDIVH